MSKAFCQTAFPPSLPGPGRDHDPGQVLGHEQVERPAHRPRLHQRPLAGQRVLDIGRPEAVDPGRQLELGRARDLGVDADHLADDIDQAVGRRPLDDVVLVQAIGHHLLP